MKKLVFILSVALLLFIPLHAKAEEVVDIYFFHGDGCPHCSEEMEFLEEIKTKYSVNIHMYEVWYNTENNRKMEIVKEHFNSKGGVPFTVVGDQAFLGFSTSIQEDIEAAIQNPGPDVTSTLIDINQSETPISTSSPTPTATMDPTTEEENAYTAGGAGESASNQDQKQVITYTLLGILVVIIGIIIFLSVKERKKTYAK